MNIKNLLFFLSGAAIGAVAGIFATKNHFKQIAEEEIESVKNVVAKKEESKNDSDIQIKNEKPALNDYMNKLKESGYVNYSKTEGKKEIAEEPDFSSKDIYTISDIEFGEEDGYEQVSLTYFNDGVLCDEDNEPLSQDYIIKNVGFDSLENFDYEETDSVYIRNDATKTDYEILRDVREYKNILEDRM